jgi:hypothetical protein
MTDAKREGMKKPPEMYMEAPELQIQPSPLYNYLFLLPFISNNFL